MKYRVVSYRIGDEFCDKGRSVESRDGSNKDEMIGEAQSSRNLSLEAVIRSFERQRQVRARVVERRRGTATETGQRATTVCGFWEMEREEEKAEQIQR